MVIKENRLGVDSPNSSAPFTNPIRTSIVDRRTDLVLTGMPKGLCEISECEL